MPTLDATKSGSTANSYSDSEAADAYFDNLYLADQWESQDENTKLRLLITASQMIDKLPIAYPKFDTTTPQSMKFPVNTAAPDADPIEEGWDAVVEATYAQALYLMRFGETIVGMQEEGLQGLKSQTLGKVSMTKASAGFNSLKNYAPDVFSLLAAWLNMAPTIYRG